VPARPARVCVMLTTCVCLTSFLYHESTRALASKPTPSMLLAAPLPAMVVA